MTMLKAPFPWFGGKRRVAHVVWRAFGHNINNYVEPFCGSCAVLLGRPGGPGKIETVNDRDRMIANFWRAVTYSPEETAYHADWPVNEADLHARHAWLVAQLPMLREQMHEDPHYHDPMVAGWWVWGICQWIGGGWCVEPQNHKHPKLDGIGKGIHSDSGHPKERNANGDHLGMGVHAGSSTLSHQIPHLAVTDGVANRGVHVRSVERKRPHLAGMDKGVNRTQSTWNKRIWLRRRPAISTAGQGVHLPSLGNDRGINGVDAPPCSSWFGFLQERLRRVRVACGDWKRVVGPSVLGKGKNVGGRRPCAVFLDPPYGHELRDSGLYAEDELGVAAQVARWAIENGDDPDLRIALCGYKKEHKMPDNWTVYEWKAARGYSSAKNKNREQERIWFSPHCLPIVDAQQALFEVGP
jgi:hypothetical protein